jgi:hypothetical protein
MSDSRWIEGVLTQDDVMAIHDLLARYGHVIDERRWHELDLIFTDDATFDATDFGVPVMTSLEEIRASWSSDLEQHPLAHHATNIVVKEADGVVRAESKGLGVLRDGRVATLVYRDELRRTAAGWRMSRRVATRRRA